MSARRSSQALRIGNGLPSMLRELAIVIPVGPGDEHWRVLLPQLARLAVREIVIVFAHGQLPGDPQPGQVDARARVAFAPRGRAAQLNAGAAATTATWLWFLHADSRPGEACADALARHVAGDWRALGYCDLRFLDDGPASMALNSIGAWIRSRWLRLPFGDQGFVISRRLLESLGGFDVGVAEGEDHDLIWRARAQHARIVPLRAQLFTSARKYALNGWWRTTAAHLLATWRQARDFSRRARA
jgi:hypothetical protein